MESDFIVKCGTVLTDKVIVCREKGRKYKAKNDSQKTVVKIHIDGELIKNGPRCDYALKIKDEKKLGRDKAHAFEQILETLQFFQAKFPNCVYYPRIVLSKNSAPNLKSCAEKKILALIKQGKCGKEIVKTTVLVESI